MLVYSIQDRNRKGYGSQQLTRFILLSIFSKNIKDVSFKGNYFEMLNYQLLFNEMNTFLESVFNIAFTIHTGGSIMSSTHAT